MGQAFTLLNPGPINVSPAVRRALAECEDQCHREPEYLAMQARVRARLARAFDVAGDYDPILLTGSGTAAMEAMVASVVGEGVLVIDNGVYGARLADMAKAHGIPCKVLVRDWLEQPEPESVYLALEDGLDTIAVVHHETTTGLLNDLGAIGEVARRTGRRLIVDSVSGLGGEAFDFDLVRPTAVCSTANKCVQGLPGVSFVFVRKETAMRRRSVYLDLATQLARQDEGGTPFTPAIQVTAALDAALGELIEETVEGRRARYRRAAEVLRGAIGTHGMGLLLPEAHRSNTITCAELPEGLAYERMHERLRERGYVVYAGQGALHTRAWRVANMGVLPDDRLAAFSDALGYAVS